tara:strand:+ start:571 stop:882 length:312 start_codon:yes stop_codon:yes gene_type:complete
MTTTNQQIAETILNQLGGARRLAVMIGAKNFVAVENGLTFKIGRGAKNKATHITITLNALDLYDVRFQSVRGAKVTERGDIAAICWDQLKPAIETATGFFLSF